MHVEVEGCVLRGGVRETNFFFEMQRLLVHNENAPQNPLVIILQRFKRNTARFKWQMIRDHERRQMMLNKKNTQRRIFKPRPRR
jgi:hypothetical protein